MMDFENLIVYQKSRILNQNLALDLLKVKGINKNTKDQLERASLSVSLNIAEGSGKNTSQSQKNFYSIARGSVFECGALITFLRDTNYFTDKQHQEYMSLLEEISKMLYSLIGPKK